MAKSRTRQRADTRERIVEAAAELFSKLGFRAASTRLIAARAGANQGLITYHFRSKDELWRAAVGRIFEQLRSSLAARSDVSEGGTPRERAREAIREFVRFAAAHPELFRLLVEQGKHDDERTRWLVDTYLKPMYADFVRASTVSGTVEDEAMIPHAYYVMAGAGSVMFAVTPECRRLTGLDPESEQTIETHADFVARLLVP